jgi:hypothetical protein
MSGFGAAARAEYRLKAARLVWTDAAVQRSRLPYTLSGPLRNSLPARLVSVSGMPNSA